MNGYEATRTECSVSKDITVNIAMVTNIRRHCMAMQAIPAIDGISIVYLLANIIGKAMNDMNTLRGICSSLDKQF